MLSKEEVVAIAKSAAKKDDGYENDEQKVFGLLVDAARTYEQITFEASPKGLTSGPNAGRMFRECMIDALRENLGDLPK